MMCMVVEGGANRTIFSVGVMDAFLEESIMPDHFIGVSAGAAFGVSYLAKQKGKIFRMLEEYAADKRFMGIRYILDRDNRAFYNKGFVFDELQNEILPFDYEKFRQYEGTVEAVVTCARTGKSEYLAVPRDKSMADTIIASCSLPLLFQPVKLNNKLYLDGGLSDPTPFKRALELGYDKVIVLLVRPKTYIKDSKTLNRITGILCHNYPSIAEALNKHEPHCNSEMDCLLDLEKSGRIFVIEPSGRNDISRIEKDPVKLRRLYEEGYTTAKRRMREIKEFLGQ